MPRLRISDGAHQWGEWGREDRDHQVRVAWTKSPMRFLGSRYTEVPKLGMFMFYDVSERRKLLSKKDGSRNPLSVLPMGAK